jgi:hypothetical protein
VEGIKNEELANVHATTTRMKPIDLDITFQGGTLLAVNRHEYVTSHGYPMCTLRTNFQFAKVPYCNTFLFF